MGDNPMNSIYKALTILTIDPVVLYSAATSGVAASTEVLEMGAKKEQKDRRKTMMSFRCAGSRSYTSSGISITDETGSTGISGPREWCVEHRSSSSSPSPSSGPGRAEGRMDSVVSPEWAEELLLKHGGESPPA